MPDDAALRYSPPVSALAGVTGEEWRCDTSFAKRLEAYAKHRDRADAMTEYIAPWSEEKSRERTAYLALRECGRLQWWRHYYEAGRTSLRKASLCHKHLLCPLCASLRGMRLASEYYERVKFVLAGDASLRAQFVTTTVKDGPDLIERCDHLRGGWKRLRKRAGRGNAPTEWAKIAGAVWSMEVKRGANSGEWHPHIHCLAVVSSPIDQAELSKQWHSITGDSMIVDVRDVYSLDDSGGGIAASFLECFKYALKFSDLSLADNFDAWQALRGQRLIGSSGVLFGIGDDVALLDPLLDDPKFYDLAFRFFGRRVDEATGEIVGGPHYRLAEGPWFPKAE